MYLYEKVFVLQNQWWQFIYIFFEKNSFQCKENKRHQENKSTKFVLPFNKTVGYKVDLKNTEL